MDFSTAFADPQKENEGVWVEYQDGGSIKLARAGTPEFNRVLENRMKPHLRKQRAGTLPSAVETKINCQVLADTVLLDWKGMTLDGKKLEYSKEAAFELLMRHIDFRNDVVDLATAGQTFHTEFAEDSEKN